MNLNSLPIPIPDPTLCDLPLPLRLSLLGQPALIAQLCELNARMERLENLLDLPPIAGATATATAAPITLAPPQPEAPTAPLHAGQTQRSAPG